MRPLLLFRKNPKKRVITQKIIPTCNPETARTCDAPDAEKIRFVSGSSSRL